eukprot:8469580-Alexandrium_andersonii.AAC.1
MSNWAGASATLGFAVSVPRRPPGRFDLKLAGAPAPSGRFDFKLAGASAPLRSAVGGEAALAIACQKRGVELRSSG